MSSSIDVADQFIHSYYKQYPNLKVVTAYHKPGIDALYTDSIFANLKLDNRGYIRDYDRLIIDLKYMFVNFGSTLQFHKESWPAEHPNSLKDPKVIASKLTTMHLACLDQYTFAASINIFRDHKTKYKRLTLLHHPDKGGDPSAFAELTRAYRLLKILFTSSPSVSHVSGDHPMCIAVLHAACRRPLGAILGSCKVLTHLYHLTLEHRDLSTSDAAQRAEVDSLKRRNADLTARDAARRAERHALEQKNAELGERHDILSQFCHQQKEKYEKQYSHIRQLDEERETLQAVIESQDEECETLQSTINRYRGELAEQKRKFATGNRVIGDLKRRRDELKEEVSHQKKQKKEVETEFKGYQKMHGSLMEAIPADSGRMQRFTTVQDRGYGIQVRTMRKDFERLENMFDKFRVDDTSYYNMMKWAKTLAGTTCVTKWMKKGHTSGYFFRADSVPEFRDTDDRAGRDFGAHTAFASLHGVFLFVLDVCTSRASGKDAVLCLLKPSYNMLVNKQAYLRALELYCNE